MLNPWARRDGKPMGTNAHPACEMARLIGGKAHSAQGKWLQVVAPVLLIGGPVEPTDTTESPPLHARFAAFS